MRFTVPKPPSINHIYGITSRGGYARSYLTKKGTDWFTEAGKQLHKQVSIKKPITSELEIHIDLFTARRQDVDNILKPILDLLQKQAVIENDSQIYFLTVQKHRCKIPDEHVEVELLGFEN